MLSSRLEKWATLARRGFLWSKYIPKSGRLAPVSKQPSAYPHHEAAESFAGNVG